MLNKVTNTAADVIDSVNKMAVEYDPSLENRTNTFGQDKTMPEIP